MLPEYLDRLLRTGEVPHAALFNQADLGRIAELCSEEFAVNLFLFTTERHGLLNGREAATCYALGMAKIALTRSAAFLDAFIDKRISLAEGMVMCAQTAREDQIKASKSSDQEPPKILDPVKGDFTTVEWEAGAVHYDEFPHLIILIQSEMPRVYSVLPMDRTFLCREDTAFEVAKIFSVYSELDVCLVLDEEKCVYIRKDGTYRISRRRPSGGAVAHRSVTGPHLYSLHAEPLTAVLSERPDAFQWYDEFDGEPDRFTGREYSMVEPVTSLCPEILRQAEDEVRQVVQEFLPVFGREWDDDSPALAQSASAWLQAVGISGSVRVIERRDMTTFSSRVLTPSKLFDSPLYKKVFGAIDVMEHDLKRAGLLETVNILLQPIYSASHIGYLRLLSQIERLAGPPDNVTYWNRIQGQLLPSAICSPVTLLRLETWRRIEHLYRNFVPPVDTQRGSFAEARGLQAALSLFTKINERGPMWMWQDGDDVFVIPAAVVRLDDEGYPHCENGPAIIDPDGTRTFAIHGDLQ